MKHKFLTLLFLSFAAALLTTACVDEETALGINLVDQSLLYDGQHATFTADCAWSVRDSSAQTLDWSAGIIGRYHDATFGTVDARLFTQIALSSSTSSLRFDNVLIDSVVLSMRTTKLYPARTQPYNVHFEVMQLAEPLLVDSSTTFTVGSSLPVDPTKLFYGSTLSVADSDTVIRLRLSEAAHDLFRQNATASDFTASTKGLRICTTSAGDEAMIGLNFLSSDSRIIVYYRAYASDTVESQYNFLLGDPNSHHFQQYLHDYAGSTTAGNDSLDGAQRLYIEPLGGYNVRLSFNNSLQTFLAQHPYATIHLAELILPVDDGLDLGDAPSSLLPFRTRTDSTEVLINDAIDGYVMSGLDGSYDADKKQYRFRVTQHLQNLLRDGQDRGMLITPNGRFSDAARIALRGYSASAPVKIEITYTE